MSVRWTVGEAEMRRVRQPKQAMRPLQGEPLMTSGGGNLISGEVSRNKRSAQWAVAPIEAAEGSAPTEVAEPERAHPKRVVSPEGSHDD